MKAELQELMKQEWYIQGFSGQPYMLPCCSLKAMEKSLGFWYNTIFFTFRNCEAQMHYQKKDLDEHAEIIMKKISSNPDYLKQKRTEYEKEVSKLAKDFETAKKMNAVSDEELFLLARRLVESFGVTVGIAHLIESISLRLETETRKMLEVKTSGKELNEDFSVLVAPVAKSFLSKKDETLWKIKNAKKEEKKALIEKFISDFFWINSSYCGNSPLSEKEVLKETSEMERLNEQDFEKIKKQKIGLFEKYSFSERQKKIIELGEFLIEWQDERKKNIFISIFSIDCALREISRRHGLSVKELHELLPVEITQQNILSGKAKEIAKKRSKGCVIIVKLDGANVFDGADYLEFEKANKKTEEKVEVINGMPASLGTATGPVKIVTTIESIAQVKQGDVLVASMTRPEYVPAMKKAVAIVTDEGGITCHAAIVSRELGIPAIVGTKIATRVLKDGDIVQVKANHGIVRKL